MFSPPFSERFLYNKTKDGRRIGGRDVEGLLLSVSIHLFLKMLKKEESRFYPKKGKLLVISE